MKRVFNFILLLISIVIIICCLSCDTKENLVDVGCLTQCLENGPQEHKQKPQPKPDPVPSQPAKAACYMGYPGNPNRQGVQDPYECNQAQYLKACELCGSKNNKTNYKCLTKGPQVNPQEIIQVLSDNPTQSDYNTYCNLCLEGGSNCMELPGDGGFACPGKTFSSPNLKPLIPSKGNDYTLCKFSS